MFKGIRAFSSLSFFGPRSFALFFSMDGGLLPYHAVRPGIMGCVCIFHPERLLISVMWNAKYSRCGCSYLVFITSRYWRLLPLFLICSLMTVWSCHVSPQYWNGYPAENFTLKWWGRTLLIAGVPGSPCCSGQAWSLDVEMEFYFFAPILVAGGILSKLLSRKNQAIILFALFFALFFLWGLFTPIQDSIIFQLLCSRSDCLCSRVAPIPQTCNLFCGSINRAGLCIRIFRHFTTNFLEYSKPSRLPVIIAVLAFLSNGFGLFAIFDDTVRQRSSSLDRTLGDLAYSTYIFHWIPVNIVNHVFLKSPHLCPIISWGLTFRGQMILRRSTCGCAS